MTNTQTAPLIEGTPANVDATIGENVHRLMWRANDRQTTIAAQWGMTQSALSLKLRGKRPWVAAEIDAAARHYGVTRDSLFRKLPGLDSNQEPIGYMPAPAFLPGDQLEQHRRAKQTAHDAVARVHGPDARTAG